MFGRRRHAAVVPAAPVPQLTDAQILELVHGKVAELIGANGEWSVSRRSVDDTDTIFHTVLTTSVSLGIAAAITDARRRLEAGEPLAEPQHLADETVVPVAPAPRLVAEESPASVTPAEPTVSASEVVASEEEPAAFTWEPAPITVWTDLRRPVTGEIPAIVERSAA